MRKLLINFTGILTFSSSVLPLVGCTFNSYINQVVERTATNLATQTSTIIKSLIVSKHLDSDTQTTINDALITNGDNDGQSIIQNHSQKTIINDWNEFQNNWGFNKKIAIKGFNKDDFIIPNGQGSLTKQINSFKSTNETLQYLSYISTLNVIDNQTLYGILFGKNAIAKPIVKDILTNLKNNTLPEPWGSLVKNLINDYQGNFLDPITQLLNEIVNGWNKVTDPKKLKAFVEQKDSEGIPYSEWIDDSGAWTMDSTFIENWTANDINLYHGSLILNHLFKKIGIENQDKIAEPKYLGGIITNILGDEKAFDPYINLLLSNPKYLIWLITALVPLIKDLIFNVPDLTQGIKHLTVGNHYPTDERKNSYNLKSVFLNLKNIINSKETINTVVDKLLESSPLLYDIKFLNSPLPEIVKKGNSISELIKNKVHELLNGPDNLSGFLNSDAYLSLVNIFNDIYKIIEKLNNQFKGSDGIDLNLENLKNLLINKNNGLLISLQKVADTIKIIKNTYAEDAITDEQLEALYESLGGQAPKNGTTPSTFRQNSILWILQTELSNTQSDLSILFKVIARDDEYQGLTNIIIDQNKNWIKENYTNYLSSSYSKSNITKIDYKTTENSTQKITNLSYEFYYEIGTNKYHFFIKGIVVDNKDSFLGIHNFKFTDIYQI